MNISNIHLSVDGNVCIATIANKAYRVNSLFYRILCCMKSGLSLEDSVTQVSAETGTDHGLLSDKFNAFIKTVQQINSTSYIRCKRIVIKEKKVNIIAHYLVWLFSRYVFVALLFIGIMTNAIYLGFNRNIWGNPSHHTIEIGAMVFLGFMLSLIIHELGHATATASVGKEAKEIGFGFYMMFPVFYTDVTSVWCMGKKERILVNVGGVYFQLLVNAIAIGVILISPLSALTIALNGLVISNLLVVIMSATPFFRNDGYWMLSDFLNIPNLLKRSDNALLHPCSQQNYGSRSEKYKLLIFGVANNMFRIYVFVRLAFNLHNNLLSVADMTVQNDMLVIVVGIIFSLIGMYWILMGYYSTFRYGNQNRY